MKGYFIIALACCASAAQAGESLHLICAGGGSAKSLTFHNGTVWGSNGTYGTVSGTSVGHEAMSGELEFELNGDTARVRVPRVFLPPAHGGSGGDSAPAWDAQKDFAGPAIAPLNRWQQLAQALMLANEFIFVD